MAARNIPNNIPVRFIVFFIDVLLSGFLIRRRKRFNQRFLILTYPQLNLQGIAGILLI
jgi:hypothetical protein